VWWLRGWQAAELHDELYRVDVEAPEFAALAPARQATRSAHGPY
jgi:hypothetical protein